MPENEYETLALRWQRVIVELNELIGESDQLGVPIANSVHYMWNSLRVYVEGLPAQIRTHNQPPTVGDQDDVGSGP